MNGDGKESFHEREEGDGWFEVKTRFHEEVAAIVSSKPLCRSSPSSSLTCFAVRRSTEERPSMEKFSQGLICCQVSNKRSDRQAISIPNQSEVKASD